MSSVYYSLLHMKRHPRSTLGVLCAYIVAVFVLISVQNAAESRQSALNSMIENLPITCTASDQSGVLSDHLIISSMYYRPLLDQNTQFSQFVKELCLKTEYECALSDGGIKRLVGITREKAVYELTRETANAITYDEGYDETLFEASEAVCVVSYDLMPYAINSADGMAEIQLSIQAELPDQQTRPVAVKLRVVGKAATEGAVYCPWLTLKENLESAGQDILFSAQSLSFTLRDNAKLDAFRTFAKQCFVEPNYFNPDDRFELALTIHDSQYLKLTQAARKNLLLLQIMRPVLFLCALLIGAFVAAIQTRNRNKELAVLRGLGTKRTTIVVQCLLEYMLISLAGTVLIYAAFSHVPIRNIMIVFAFFICGMAMTVTRSLFKPLIGQVRELEV